MQVEDGKTCPTLRAEAHQHQPIAVTAQMKSYGVETSLGRGFSCMEETSTTLRVSTYKNGVLTVINEPKIYENHSQDARYRDIKDCAPTCNAQMGTGGNNVPLLVREEYEIDKSGNTVCYPLNGMTMNKGLKEGDRQTTGIGKADDALPTISAAHHHAVAAVRKDDENEEELPFDCALCGHRGETREVDIAEQLREEHPTWVPGWLDELEPIRLTLWGCPECNEWHAPRAWNDIQVRRTIKTKLLAVLDGDKINKKERRGGSGLGISEEPVAYTNTAKDVHGVGTDTHGANTKHLTVRRLLPVETERLMGFPDNWTRIPWKGKKAEQCPDGPRYKACGNSMCVNCMEWIGERIEKVERNRSRKG